MKKQVMTLFSLLFLTSILFGQVPQKMSFQGSLVDPTTGVPKSDGTYDMNFSLWDDSEPGVGNGVWGEDHNGVAVQNGLFNVVLGSQGSDLSAVSFDKPLWLEIIVDGETLSPRIEMTASAYSLASSSVIGSANKFPSLGSVLIGTINPESFYNPNGDYKLTVMGDINHYKENGFAALEMTGYSNNAWGSGVLRLNKARGSNYSSRSPVLGGDYISAIDFNGYDGTNLTHGAFLHARAAEDFTSTGTGTDLIFGTTDIGSTNATGRMTIASTGSIGIGTEYPAASLHIKRENGISELLMDSYNENWGSAINLRRARGTIDSPNSLLGSDVTGSILFYGWNDSGDFGFTSGILATVDENDIRYGNLKFINKSVDSPTDGSSTRMIITHEGNVGIGTQSPTNPLEIKANNPQLKLSDDVGSWTFWGGGELVFNNGVTDILILGSSGISVDGSINASSFIGDGSGLTNLPSSSSVWSGTGNIYYNGGNVGIGSSSPGRPLDIIADGGGGHIRLSESDQSGNFWDINGATNFGIAHQGTTDIIYISHNDQSLTLNPSSTIINNNVGIGTSSPYSKLTLDGGSTNELQLPLSIRNRDQTESGGTATGIEFSTENGDYGKGALVYERTSAYGQGSFHFLQNQNNDFSRPDLSQAKMSITTDGNVGIGTTQPDSDLEIENTGEAGIHIDGGANAILSLDAQSDADYSGIVFMKSNIYTGSIDFDHNAIDEQGLIRFITKDGNPRMVIKGDGTIGIGTTIPASKLHIYDNAPQLRLEDVNGYWEIQGGGDLSIKDESNELLTLTGSAGYIGIKTTGPTVELDVNGNVRIRGLGAGTVSSDANGNLTSSSDIRLKTDISNFEKGLSEITRLEPITYKWKKESGFETSQFYGGFSAQNVLESIPEAVGMNAEGFLTLSDRPIIAALVNSIKEQQQMIENQQKQINDLEKLLKEVMLSIEKSGKETEIQSSSKK